MSIPLTETVLDYQPDKLQLLQMEGMFSGRARWELTPATSRDVLPSAAARDARAPQPGVALPAPLTPRCERPSIDPERPCCGRRAKPFRPTSRRCRRGACRL